MKITKKEIRKYSESIHGLLGLRLERLNIILKEDFFADTDIKTKYICGEKQLLLVYNPANIDKLSVELHLPADLLLRIGFVESLSYAIQQYHYHKICLNGCDDCRLNKKLQKYRYENTLITYRVVYELFRSKEERSAIDHIIRYVAKDDTAMIKKKIFALDLKKLQPTSFKPAFKEDYDANLLFHILKKYRLLPMLYGSYYLPRPATAENLLLFTEKREAIGELLKSSQDSFDALAKINRLGVGIKKAIEEESVDFERQYFSLKRLSKAFLARMAKVRTTPGSGVGWQAIGNRFTKIKGLKIPQNLVVMPCVPLMGSAFVMHDTIYCSPTKSGDGGIIHEMIHMAIRDEDERRVEGQGRSRRPGHQGKEEGRMGVAVDKKTWERLGCGEYGPEDFAEQAYALILETRIKKGTPFEIKNPEGYLEENGVLAVYKLLEKMKPDYEKLDYATFVKMIEYALRHTKID
jgi:hypothetical protein